MAYRLISLLLLLCGSAHSQPWSMEAWGRIPQVATGGADLPSVLWQSQTNHYELINGGNSFAFNVHNTNSSSVEITALDLRVFPEHDTNVTVQLRSAWFGGTQYGSNGTTGNIPNYTTDWRSATFAINPVIPANTDFWVCVIGGGPGIYIYTANVDCYEGSSYHVIYYVGDVRDEDPAFRIWVKQ